MKCCKLCNEKKEEIQQNKRKYCDECNKTRKKQIDKKYYNQEHVKKAHQNRFMKLYNDPTFKINMKEYLQKYNKTEKGKESKRKRDKKYREKHKKPKVIKQKKINNKPKIIEQKPNYKSCLFCPTNQLIFNYELNGLYCKSLNKILNKEEIKVGVMNCNGKNKIL